MLVYPLELSGKWENMYTATKHKAAIDRFNPKYPWYIVLLPSINSWKRQFSNQSKDLLPPIFNKGGGPNLLRDELL